MEREFDVVVLGAGPAGEVIAGRLAQRGKRVVLVECRLIGGECSFWACMPSKALLRPAEALAEIRRIPGATEAVTGRLDVSAVLARRDEVIHNLDDESQLPWIQSNGIELVRGRGRLEGERRIRVGEEMLCARDVVVLAVGSGPLFLPIPGLAEAGAWSNREMTTAKEVPGRLVVLGGGVVGVEMAQAWSSLGSQVTIVEALDRLIAREEPSASAQVQAGLERAGVTIRVGCKATAARRSGSTVELELESGECLTAEEILVAVGRRPHTADLGLETIGLEPGGYIEVDDTMRVRGLDWLYAVGDVNGRALLTHQGKYQGRVAGDNILGTPARATHDGAVAPRVIFTDPQVAAVGMTAAAADEAGISTRVIELATSGTAGASFYGRNTEGSTRFVVDAEREVLIGATFVGFEVADFLQAATIAVTGEVPLPALAHAVAPFPTRSEIWLKFVEAYEKERGVSLHAESARAAASLP
jgi:dihydrolipoamide dehydrogenase